MKRLYFVLAGILAGLFMIQPVYGQGSYTHLVWSEDFDYTGTPDNSKWSFDIGGDGWGNNEAQYYTNRLENAKVEDGKLIITALKETYGSNEYTSARLATRNKGDWLYARVEVRAKLPYGTGTWSAIWMLPTDWEYGGWPASGEIDIMEHVGFDMGNVHGTIHTEAYNGMDGTQKGGSIYIPDVHEAFHVYAVEWTEDSIHFIADDVCYFSYPNYHTGYERWPYDKRFHLLLNIAIGGNWGGIEGIDDEIFPQTMEVDYVRVYQKFQQHQINGPSQVDAFEDNITYFIAEFPGAEYQWSFPEGVTVTDGQGTSEVTVTWGEVAGTISVVQTYNSLSYTSTYDVSVISTPGNSLLIRGDENGIGTWKINEGSGNTIEMKYEE
jgi:beta-glucanase (GH16 family)